MIRNFHGFLSACIHVLHVYWSGRSAKGLWVTRLVQGCPFGDSKMDIRGNRYGERVFLSSTATMSSSYPALLFASYFALPNPSFPFKTISSIPANLDRFTGFSHLDHDPTLHLHARRIWNPPQFEAEIQPLLWGDGGLNLVMHLVGPRFIEFFCLKRPA